MSPSSMVKEEEHDRDGGFAWHQNMVVYSNFACVLPTISTIHTARVR
jgi:hypothetical protein